VLAAQARELAACAPHLALKTLGNGDVSGLLELACLYRQIPAKMDKPLDRGFSIFTGLYRNSELIGCRFN